MAQVTTNQRLKITFFSILSVMIVISVRLFYWQVIKAQDLKSAVTRQTTSQNIITGQRGQIYTADNWLLVGNKTVYDLYLNKREIQQDQLEIINQLTDIFTQHYAECQEKPVLETQQLSSTCLNYDKKQFEQKLVEAFSRSSSWILLTEGLDLELKTQLETTKIHGLHLIEQSIRHYPEGSMAAHITGFVGKGDNQEVLGYFGIEGALDKELQGQEKKISYRKDAKGRQLADQKLDFSNLDGRDITLTIRRDIQFIASEELIKGVMNTGSQSGELIIMNPSTGAILALATWPHYDPERYHQTPTEAFKNPTLTALYEPGSTFKIFTLAAALDAHVVTPETICDQCAGPRVFGNFTIKTWNEKYHPNTDMKEALKNSDNVALVFVVEKLGEAKFRDYLSKFGIGESLEIDLQEDRTTPIKTNFRPVELANASFGQGFLTNTLQMIRAAGALANQGMMMKPYIIQQVRDTQTQETIEYQPQPLRRVISTEAATQITQMMIYAAPKRETLISHHYTIAGKTGTAQIASAGGYREQGSIASFIGFAPAEHPKFIMIVKLNEPTISPWAEATAVPIWYNVADKLLLLL